MASKYGIDLLKKQGASKDYLNYSKKDLLKAFGTYTKDAVMDSIISEEGRFIGKLHQKYIYRKQKEKEDKENK